MPGQRVKPRFTGGFGGFLPPPDLPPLGDYEAPTTPVPSLTVYPGGGRQSSTYNTPRSPNNPNAGYESVSRTLFADDSYNPRPYSPGREFNDPDLPTDSSPPDLVPITTPDPPPPDTTVDISGSGGGLPSPYWNQPSGGYAQPGRDIAGFGSNMSLGQFLSTPLALMRFGTDRFQPGNTPNIQSADQIQVGTTSPTGPTGSQMWTGTEWVDAQPSNSNVVPSPDRTDPAFVDPGTNAGPNSPGAAGSGRGPSPVTGSSPMETRFAPNSGTGNYVADQTAKAFLGWNPADSVTNNPGQGDMKDIFYPVVGNPIMHFDPESGFAVPSDQKYTRGQRDPRWVFPSQSESNRLGLSFSNNADKYNNWLIAHNQWYYGKG
jgi:hypothetical protein